MENDLILKKVEQVVLTGDLKTLTETERVFYYKHLCASLGLNPLTHPFDYITLNGKLTLYAKKSCTDQLRAINKAACKITKSEMQGDLFMVTANVSVGDRAEEDIGVVCIGHLKGDAKANAIMKATTKAKRRATLSLFGVGLLDESEVEDIKRETKNVKAEVAPQPGIEQQKEPQDDSVVTKQERAHMFSVAEKYDWDMDGMRIAIKELYGIDSTANLKRDQFDEFVSVILPMKENKNKQEFVIAIQDYLKSKKEGI